MLSEIFDRHVSHLKSQAPGEGFDEGYYFKHKRRFLKTCDFIPVARGVETALEVGSTEFFQVTLRHHFNFSQVIGTEFHPDIERKLYTRHFRILDQVADNVSISLDLESDLFPFEAERLDFILCAEVIEHLDRDPMFMLAEFNRLLKPGGHLLITTPNCCSARNFWKIAHGYRPHFFMQYERSRSPYRHNFEYDVGSLLTLTDAAGFRMVRAETEDVFEGTMPEAIELLRKNDLPLDHRGDDIFLLVQKEGPVKDRWPDTMYV